MNDRIEPRADRQTWIFILLFLAVSFVVVSTSRQMESSEPAAQIWVFEFTSHLMVLAAAAIIPFWLSKFPLSSENWVRRIPIYAAGFAVFGAIHILGMMALRTLAFGIFFEQAYHGDLLSWTTWVYELRKDFMTFVLVLAAFLITRQLWQLRLEADIARQDARQSGRITLKCGGRLLFLDAKDILYAKAAGNYIEVFTDSGMHLVRMTMSALEDLLSEAGQHLRVHRSYMVRTQAISEMRPNGEGEAVLSVPNNVQIPVSRKYRGIIEKALATDS